MPPEPIHASALGLDLSPRYAQSTAVAGSPALAAETIVASVTINANVSTGLGVLLEGWVAFTVGTSGVSATLRIRQTGLAGTVIAASGALTVVAANLVSFSIQGIDTAATLPGQVYALTLQIGSGAAASTVSATQLVAQAI